MSFPFPRSPQSASGGPATQLDTTGAAVDVSGAAPPTTGQVLTATSATTATWQTPASGAASAVEASVNFGATFTEYATATVAAAWVTATSKIAVTPFATAAEAQDVLLHGFQFAITDRVAGVGFTLHVWAAREAKGTYTFHCIGV